MQYKIGDEIIWVATSFDKIHKGRVTRFHPDMVWVDNQHALEDHIAVRHVFPASAEREVIAAMAIILNARELEQMGLELMLNIREAHGAKKPEESSTPQSSMFDDEA